MKGDAGEESRGSEDALTRLVIEAIIAVHNTLGPGFVEQIYQRALAIELTKKGLRFATEAEIEISYEGQMIGRHRLDFLIEGKVIVELKTVEDLGRAHYAQVRSYLRATGLEVALLVNFSKERADYRRVVSSPHPPLSPPSPFPASP
ncbi:MAG TPA: GxxExxY protein [Stellaceae bacterium]|nr:GxxExxY protein [Stellaceae bacterium]